MTARRLDGAALAADLRHRTAAEIATLRKTGLPAPRLDVVLVGEDAASAVYVGRKAHACGEVGIDSKVHRLPAHTDAGELLDLVRRLTADASVDGILIQLPLPAAIEAGPILEAVDPDKDVDGFHPVNAGALAQGWPRVVPCTPAGILALLRSSDVPLAGTRAVVLGRSRIVGRPMALLLLQEDATVTICHSRSRNLEALCRTADLLVVAVGRPGLVTPAFVRPGAVVIDVGMHRLPGPVRRLVGDVDPAVAEVAGALTPVPGGVGPLTVAMLLRNTVDAWRRRHGRTDPAAA